MHEAAAQTSARLGELLTRRQMMMATAESCTGGWVAKLITDIPGCSHWFERGFVTYTNSAKQEMLGVSAATLERHGAVSTETVTEMAEGAIRNSHAQLALAISGIAGPGGGSEEKPVGTVCLAWAGLPQTRAIRCQFEGDRDAVRLQAAEAALSGLIEYLENG